MDGWMDGIGLKHEGEKPSKHSFFFLSFGLLDLPRSNSKRVIVQD